MSEIDGKGSGSEVSESTEVSETLPAETGGEASEATQEAATEEANESGGFENTDNTETPEDGDEDYEATESDYESDESQDVGFNDGEDVDNTASQPDETDLDEDDDVFPTDENRVGFDDSDIEYNDDSEDNSDTSDEDIDRSNDSLDDSLDEPRDDSNDFDDDIEDPDLDEQQADEDPGELEDYSGEDNLEADPDENDSIDEIDADGELDESSDSDPDGGNAFENDQDANDDDETQDEDFVAQSDATDTTDGADTDGTPDGNPDDMTDGDDDLDNGQDANDNDETQDEDFDAQSDATDATDGADTDGTPDGDPDGEVDGDGQVTEDEAQSEPPDAQSEGGDANTNENADSGTDGDDVSDDTRDSDLDVDEDLDNELAGDYEEDEDPGELEQYPEDDSENREEDRDSADTDDKTERGKEKEDRAAEEENQEASEQAEQEAATVESDNIDQDEIHSAEGENEKAVEETPETESEKPVSDENVETTRPEEDSDVTLETDTDTLDQDIDELESSGDEDEDDDLYDSDEYQDEGEVERYDDVNPATKENGVDQDAETDESSLDENPLADEVSKSIEDSENDDAHRSAINNMAEYMNEHNYDPDDYAEYSKDPEWQKLNADLQRSLGMEVTSEAPDTTLTPESGKDVSSTELPDNCVVVNASDIDMTYAQGMDSDQFWNHHGNTKEDYMRVAERIPDVQQALDSGKSLDEIKQDPELGDTARAYFDPENMIKVEQQSDGSYSFTDDGRHRIAAAQEYGYQIPVEVTNMPENANASDADGSDIKPNVDSSAETNPEETTAPKDINAKSDISSETRENLGAFEQSNWDNLSQAEKEKTVERLRDSIAEDLQLENKPNIVYYDNERPGDYGGYAASTNTIYINRFNMGDAAETADTIAHESRHCWQHERANDPQTEQDYQFKNNFDNYVRPELNFEAYQSQPVEQDARDYAEQVKNLIPRNEITPDDAPEFSAGEKDENKTENPRAPPDERYQSKTVTELPADFESKNVADVEIIKKEAPSIRGVDDFRSHMNSVYKDGNRTVQEKFEYAKKLYNEIPEGQRTDINVVDNFKAIRTDKESLDKGIEGGHLSVAFHDHHGLDESKPINGIENGQPLPDILCRRGPETGNNLTELHEDGSIPTVDEIAVPYAENPEAIHIYKTDAEGYKEAIDIISSVDENNLTDKAQEMNDLIDKMNDKYDLANEHITEDDLLEFNKLYNNFQDCGDTKQCRKDGNFDSADDVNRSKYGVCGTVAPMYVDDNPGKEKLYNGGAAQYNTPCPISTFTSIGVFREG